MWSLFVTADAPDLFFSDQDRRELEAELARVPGLRDARIMVPETSPADQPFAADGRGPSLALQLNFEDRSAAEAAVGPKSQLSKFPVLRGLAPSAVSHQLMQGRRFATPAAPVMDPCLTFLVRYPGPAENENAWLDHYDRHHPPVMVRFPRIREVETFRPTAWSSALSFLRDTAMQRNKVVFDSLADLIAALASPVMLEMRADTKGFPPFTGKTTHFPMTTWRVEGRNG